MCAIGRCGIFGVLLVVSAIGSAFAGQEIRVGVFDFPPYCSLPRDTGSLQCDGGGLFITLLRDIAKKENWNIRFVPGTVEECIQRLAIHEIDLVPALSFSQYGDRRIAFTRETVAATWAEVRTAAKRKVRSLTDLDGFAVGVMRDDPYGMEFRTLMTGLHLNCKLVEFNGYEEMASAMQSDWIDAGLFDRYYAGRLLSSPGRAGRNIVLSPVELRFAVAADADNQVGTTIDYRLTLLKNDDRSVYYRLLDSLGGTGRESSVVPAWVKWGTGMVAAVLLFFVLINMALRAQIRMKTGELLEKNRELEGEVAMRRAAEEEKNNGIEQLHKTISSLRDAVIVAAGRHVLHCNRIASDMFGVTTGTIFDTSILSRLFQGGNGGIDAVHRVITDSGDYFSECSLARIDRTVFPAEVAIKPIGEYVGEESTLIVIVRDISEREQLKKSEAMLRQAQKMEAIGTLAGGIAHDFNNILVPILGYAQLIGQKVKDESSLLTTWADQIALAAERARDLVRQIMAFSRQREKEVRRLKLSTIVKETLKLLRASTPSTISIVTDIETDHDLISADPANIHQIIMNLSTNAVYAMREKGGTLRVEIRHHAGVVASKGINEGLAEGHWVVLSVTDTGPGIDPSILHRVFEPFYTTKPQSEGTGLGLAVVHGIVKDYGGTVHVESTMGQGCRFDVYFPSATADSESERNITAAPVEFAGKGARVLLVDDEELNLDMVTELLTSLGCSVDCYSDSRKALNSFTADVARYDIVITDQTMPELTGKELSTRILRCRPDIPVILCTGYSETFTREQAMAIGIRFYLMKPFCSREIISAINAVLGTSRFSDKTAA